MRPFKTILYAIFVLLSFHYSYAESNFGKGPNFDTLYYQGQYEAIIQIAKNSISNSSSNIAYNRLWLGKAYYHNFQLDSSAKYLQELIETKGLELQLKVESYIYLIQIDVQLRQIESGHVKLKQLEEIPVDISSTDIYPLFLFAKAKLVGYKNGFLAIQLLKESLAIFPDRDPDKIHLSIWYASVMRQRRDSKQVEKFLSQAIYLQKKYFENNAPLFMAANIFSEDFNSDDDRLSRYKLLFQEKMLPVLKKSNSNWSLYYMAEYHRLIGGYADSGGQVFEAIRNFESFIKEIDGVMPRNYFRKAEVYSSLSELYFSFQKHLRAFECLELAGEIYAHQQNYYNTLRYFWSKAKLLSETRDYEDSNIYLRKIINHSAGIYYPSFVSSAKIQLIENYYLNHETWTALKGIDLIRKNEKENLEQFYFLKDKLTNIQLKCINSIPTEIRDSLISAISNKQMPRIIADFNATTIDIFNSLSLIQIDLKKPDSALFFLDKIKAVEADVQKVLNSRYNINMTKTFIETCQLIADANLMKYSDTGDIALLNDAINYLKKAEKTLSTGQSGYKNQYDRIKVASVTKELYKRAVDAYYQLYAVTNKQQFVDSAFYYSELSKSAALMESVNDNLAIQSTNIPDSLSIGIESLRNQLSYITTKIKGLEKAGKLPEKDSTSLSNFKVKKITTTDSLESKLLFVRENFSNYYDANFRNSTISIAEIQQQLKTDELAIEYLVGVDQLFRFTIAHHKVAFETLPFTLESEVSKFQKILQPEYFMVNEKSAYNKFMEQSHYLFLKLIPEFSRYPDIKRLFIIPDKHLNFLPFELLISASQKKGLYNYKNLSYLVNDYNISYGYSSTLLFDKRQGASKPKRSTPRLLAVAPSYKDILTDTIQLAQLGEYRDGFEELYYNKEEVESIGSYFNSKVLSGSKATESAVMKVIKDYNILHFAMHALVDNENSENSKFIFSNSRDSLDDSFLHNYELYNTSLNCDLAVLSACNTGNGNLASGEGVMSLSRAFTYAGAKSVVTSHWRVNDQSSSELMKLFYKELAEGKSKDEALRLAKLAFLENANPLFHHPFHWNNFVVVGDISPVIVKTSWYESIYFYLLIIIIMSSIFVYMKKIR